MVNVLDTLVEEPASSGLFPCCCWPAPGGDDDDDDDDDDDVFYLFLQKQKMVPPSITGSVDDFPLSG